MYAIIETGGKQYRVQEGDTLFVEKLAEHYGLIKKKHVELMDIVEDDVKDFFKIVDEKVRKIFEEWFGEV